MIDAGSYKVTERSEGANMSVDIAASTGEGAWVKGDSVTSQGLYFIPPHTAKINETLTAADASNPRIDQVILEALDDTHAAGGLNKSRVRVLTGTATSGATLDNPTGAAALPSSAIRLADILVAASDTSIGNSEIRDRRPWARGAYFLYERTAGNYTGTNTSFADVDSTNTKPRLECSGGPVRVRVAPGFISESGAGVEIELGLSIDGAAEITRQLDNVTANQAYNGHVMWIPTPTAGSHTFALRARGVAAGTWSLRADTTYPFYFEVEEATRPSASNT